MEYFEWFVTAGVLVYGDSRTEQRHQEGNRWGSLGQLKALWPKEGVLGRVLWAFFSEILSVVLGEPTVLSSLQNA